MKTKILLPNDSASGVLAFLISFGLVVVDGRFFNVGSGIAGILIFLLLLMILILALLPRVLILGDRFHIGVYKRGYDLENIKKVAISPKSLRIIHKTGEEKSIPITRGFISIANFAVLKKYLSDNGVSIDVEE